MHSPNQETPVWRIILGGTIGNLAEWYNFLLFGYLAAVISKLFFPVENSWLSLTFTFTIFALSFLVRPLGGILFGWIGDVHGRQRALVFSLLLMGIPTLLIGCLPGFQTIGIASPLLLCVLRMLQGLSAGGEHTGSAIYVAEHAPSRHRTLWVSTVPTSAAFGVLISSATALIIVHSFSETTLLAWGWRVAYWAGALLSFASLLLRLTLPETPAFEKMKQQRKNKTWKLSLLFTDKAMRAKLSYIFLLASAWGIFYQILFIWMPTYLNLFIHLPHSTALLINSACLLLFALLILVAGYCADYFCKERLLKLSCWGFLVFSYPLFTLLASGILWKICLAMVLFSILFSIYIPTSFISMVEKISVEERYTGLSLGFNLGLALFGGTCPLIVTWLIRQSGSVLAPALYMTGAAFIVLKKISPEWHLLKTSSMARHPEHSEGSPPN